MEEKFLQPEEQKEERNYQLKVAFRCDLSLFLILYGGFMSSYESLKKNRDFEKVHSFGISKGNKYLVMYILENHRGENRLGIQVSKKVGNSVVRHRLTRLIRESYRLNSKMFNSGLDIVIIARVSAKDRTYKEIESALLHLGKIQNILKEG